VTRYSTVACRVIRRLVPNDSIGFGNLVLVCPSCVLASALLPSLSSFIPKVSREICVCFRLFVCDPRSCDWDIGRVLLRKNFYRLLVTPPTLSGRQSGPSAVLTT
jgi:hypothetical protein